MMAKKSHTNNPRANRWLSSWVIHPDPKIRKSATVNQPKTGRAVVMIVRMLSSTCGYTPAVSEPDRDIKRLGAEAGSAFLYADVLFDKSAILGAL
jgi:hypothetical protein